MYQRDTIYYSRGYSLDNVRKLVQESEENMDSKILFKISDANRRRFERYFEIFDYYFENREDVFLEHLKPFEGKFNLSHDFIVMANICSIIETYYQFNHGIAESPYRNNVVCYKWAFEKLKYQNNSYNEENAILFYKRIRNGLIHQTNTNIKAALSDCYEPIMVDGDDFLLCNTQKIYKHIRKSINNYFHYIHTKPIESDVVKNLIKKTKYILD